MQSYLREVEETIDLAVKIQTVVAVVSSVLLWKFSELLGPKIGSLTILLTLFGIPNAMSRYGKWRLRRYAEIGWKRKFPTRCFSGKWTIQARITKAYEVKEVDISSITNRDQEGDAIISQNAFGLVSIQQNIRTKTTDVDLGEVTILPTMLSEENKLYTVYQMTPAQAEHAGIRSELGGYGVIEVRDIATTGDNEKPKRLVTNWCDRVDYGKNVLHVFVGETEYRRVPCKVPLKKRGLFTRIKDILGQEQPAPSHNH